MAHKKVITTSIKPLCSICVISGYFDHNIVMILYRKVHDKLTLLCCGLDSGCLPCDSLTHRLRYLPQTLKHCTLIYIHYVLRWNPTSSCFSIQLLNLWGFVWPQLDRLGLSPQQYCTGMQTTCNTQVFDRQYCSLAHHSTVESTMLLFSPTSDCGGIRLAGENKKKSRIWALVVRFPNPLSSQAVVSRPTR